jgi:DNA polymerase III delta prime subunit
VITLVDKMCASILDTIWDAENQAPLNLTIPVPSSGIAPFRTSVSKIPDMFTHRTTVKTDVVHEQLPIHLGAVKNVSGEALGGERPHIKNLESAANVFPIFQSKISPNLENDSAVPLKELKQGIANGSKIKRKPRKPLVEGLKGGEKKLKKDLALQSLSGNTATNSSLPSTTTFEGNSKLEGFPLPQLLKPRSKVSQENKQTRRSKGVASRHYFLRRKHIRYFNNYADEDDVHFESKTYEMVLNLLRELQVEENKLQASQQPCAISEEKWDDDITILNIRNRPANPNATFFKPRMPKLDKPNTNASKLEAEATFHEVKRNQTLTCKSLKQEKIVSNASFPDSTTVHVNYFICRDDQGGGFTQPYTMRERTVIPNSAQSFKFKIEDISTTMKKVAEERSKDLILPELVERHDPDFIKDWMDELFERKKSDLNHTSWAFRYRPLKITHVVGNREETKKLFRWLKKWRIPAIKSIDHTKVQNFFGLKPSGNERRAPKKRKKVCLSLSEVNDDINDFIAPDSGSEYEESARSSGKRRKDSRTAFSNDTEDVKGVTILEGPVGSCKSAAVYACAEQLGLGVIEINAGMHRSAKDLESMIGELIHSHTIRKSALPNANGNKGSVGVQSLILIEDADILFSRDETMWKILQSYAISSKRPIVITCNELNFMLMENLHVANVFRFKRPNEEELVWYLQMILYIEGFAYCKCDIPRLLKLKNQDLRSALMNAEFFALNNGWCMEPSPILAPTPSFLEDFRILLTSLSSVERYTIPYGIKFTMEEPETSLDAADIPVLPDNLTLLPNKTQVSTWNEILGYSDFILKMTPSLKEDPQVCFSDQSIVLRPIYAIREHMREHTDSLFESTKMIATDILPMVSRICQYDEKKTEKQVHGHGRLTRR